MDLFMYLFIYNLMNASVSKADSIASDYQLAANNKWKRKSWYLPEADK
jgi:hypothetical protein